MNTKHTTGPWEVVSTVAHPYAIHADGKQLAAVQSAMNTIPGPERAANARLIAAAPELLEALVELTKWANVAGCGREEGSVLDQNINAARAAIAKATNA